MKYKTLFFFLILFTVGAAAFAQTIDFLDYDDPVYDVLERLYVRGDINYLPQVRPLMKKTAIDLLREGNRSLSMEKDASLLNTVNKSIERLSGKMFHVMDTGDGHVARGTLDFGAEVRMDSALNRVEDTVPWAEQRLIAALSVSNFLYIDLVHGYKLIFEPYTIAPYRKFYDAPPYPDYNLYTWNLDRDTAKYNFSATHIPGEDEFSIRVNTTSQLSVDGKYVQFHVGRESLGWGPSPFANLALSETSKPYEYLRLDIPFAGKGMFTWMTGFLENREQDYNDAVSENRKLINAHRAEFQFAPWFLFALYESVVYSYRFELGYLNPFSIYYVSEVRLGDYDNKLGGADFVFRFPKVKFYLSIFADDWDFAHLFDINYYHNEFGALIGTELQDVLINNVGVSAEYAYMSHWMYTHRNDIRGHATNNYTHFGSHLGHPLQPNSHMFQMKITYSPNMSWKTGLTFWLMEDSWGDIYTPPKTADSDEDNWDMDGLYTDWEKRYNFLDYGIDGVTREINFDIGVFGEYYLPFFGIKLHADLAYAYTWNVDKQLDENRSDLFFTLSFQWQGY